MTPSSPIQLEVWSDVVCPFCYIGKRRMEAALEELGIGQQVDITWRSFLLDPGAKPAPGVGVYEHLAERKGITLEQSKQMHQQVTAAAKEVGLDYHYDIAKVANTVDCHRLLHLAREYGQAEALKERLLKAYFSEGADLNDKGTLQALASEVGLPADPVEVTLSDKARYRKEVDAEMREAHQLGATGVPFFVVDRKYGVMGAQPTETFVQTLQKALADRPEALDVTGGGAPACGPDQDC